MKIAAPGRELRIVVWLREFLLVHTQRVRVRGQSLEEVKSNVRCTTSEHLGALLFPAYVNHIWKNTESTFRLFMEDCVIYRKIVSNSDVEKLQTVLSRLGEWVVENWMKINSGISKAVSFTRAWVKDPLNYSLLDQEIP
jgi:hypothetical protein